MGDSNADSGDTRIAGDDEVTGDPRRVPQFMYVCAKEIIRLYKPLLDPLDLTYTQYLTMLALWENGDSSGAQTAMSVKQIGNVLYLDSGTLTPVLNKLEAKGFITKRRSDVDQRSVDVLLTAKGLALRAKTVGISSQILEMVGLSESDAQILYLLLGKALEKISR